MEKKSLNPSFKTFYQQSKTRSGMFSISSFYSTNHIVLIHNTLSYFMIVWCTPECLSISTYFLIDPSTLGYSLVTFVTVIIVTYTRIIYSVQKLNH